MSYGVDKLKMGQIFTFLVKYDLEDQGRLPPKTTLIKVLCIFGSNLEILAWTYPELSHGQINEWYTHTHGHIDRRRQRQYPLAQTGLG